MKESKCFVTSSSTVVTWCIIIYTVTKRCREDFNINNILRVIVCYIRNGL